MSKTNRNTIAILQQQDIQIVKVAFEGANDAVIEHLQKNKDVKNIGVKSYGYKLPKGIKVEVGNYVIVPNSLGVAEFALARVVELNAPIDLKADFEYKWVVQVVDDANYRKCLDFDKSIQTTLDEAERLRTFKEVQEAVLSVHPAGSEADLQFRAQIEASRDAIRGVNSASALSHDKKADGHE